MKLLKIEIVERLSTETLKFSKLGVCTVDWFHRNQISLIDRIRLMAMMKLKLFTHRQAVTQMAG